MGPPACAFHSLPLPHHPVAFLAARSIQSLGNSDTARLVLASQHSSHTPVWWPGLCWECLQPARRGLLVMSLLGDPTGRGHWGSTAPPVPQAGVAPV